jgi:hypothetical protein
MSNLNTPAANQYRANLNVFKSLRQPGRKFKLAYNGQTGLFETQSDNVLTSMSRTFSRTTQSVTSEANFATPVREVFMEAVLSNTAPPELNEALEGLRKLRDTYNNEPDKLRVLGKLLADLQDMIQERGPPLDRQILDAMARAKPLLIFSPEDLDFLDRLLEDDTIMNYPARLERRSPSAAPAELSQLIYRQYGGAFNDGTERIPDHLDWLQSLPRAPFKPRLQNCGVSVPGHENLIANSPRWARDFIYFSTKITLEEELWRIYLNVRWASAAAVLQELADAAKTYHVHAFKVAGPADFHSRADKVVVYVYSLALAQRLANHLHVTFPAGFNAGHPAMTTVRYPGIALGIEPRSVPLGFGHRQGSNPGHEPQSYGTIRSQLLASAVWHFHMYKEMLKLPAGVLFSERYHDREAFLRLAAVAFRGYRDDLRPPYMG